MFDKLESEYSALKKSNSTLLGGIKASKIGSRSIFLVVLFFSFVTIVSGSTYYLSPTGNDTTGDGTIGNPWFSLSKAWAVVSAGDTIYLRGGDYKINSPQNLTRGVDGSSGNYIYVLAYPNETPNITRGSSYSWTGSAIWVKNSDYIYFKGLEISYFQQQSGEYQYGHLIFTDCNNCIWENINYHHNSGGAKIYNNSVGNLIYNCDFHHNYDPYNNEDPYGAADGLEIKFMGAGSENTVRGCRFYRNSDDGLDVWENDGSVTIDSCWAWHNGYREDGVTTGGDGVGLKLGKTITSDGSTFNRILTNSLCFNNRTIGISQNSAYCKMYIYNNTIYNNNLGIYFTSTWGNQESVFRNNISYGNATNINISQTASIIDHNTWNGGFAVSDADFMSVDTSGVSGPRQARGKMPELNFMKLAIGSDIIDAGIDVGFEYNGLAPDLGAFELETIVNNASPKYITEEVTICEGESYIGWIETGTYQRTLIAASGVDSIVTTNLTVNPVYHIFEDISIQEGENYLGWTVPGEYERNLISMTGCDSIVATSLSVTLNKYSSEEVVICEGESYMGWTEAGIYQRSLTAASGADSIVTTNLTVNPVYHIFEDIVISEGESYMGWTETGEYERNLNSVTGCDSIVTTILYVETSNTSSVDIGLIGDLHQNVDSQIYNLTDPDQLININKSLFGSVDFIMYPNPAESYVNVEFSFLPNNQTTFEIVNNKGIIVFNCILQSSKIKIDLNDLPPGVYHVISRSKYGINSKLLIIK